MKQEFVMLPREVVEQALAYVEQHAVIGGLAVRDALRAALEQPQGEQEPAAFAIFTEAGNARMWSTLQPHVRKLADAEGLTVTPLYTRPQPKRKPLIGEAERQCPYPKANPSTYNAWLDGWEAAERAHGIK